MKHNLGSFEEYLQYLDSIKSRLPKHVLEFACDIKRYDIDSPSSLHDAWLQSLSIVENRLEERVELNVKLVLLGQSHDREIILMYENVRSYKITGNENTENYNDTFHGDLNSHEIRVSEKGNIIHEIAFFSESTILIECGDLNVSERNYT